MQNQQSLQGLAEQAREAYETGGLAAATPLLFAALEEWGQRHDAYHRAFEIEQQQARAAAQNGHRDLPSYRMTGRTQRHGIMAQ